jgi:hypothetical protein
MTKSQRFIAWILANCFLTLLSLVLLTIFKSFISEPVRIACVLIIVVLSSGFLFFTIRKETDVENSKMDIPIQKVAATILFASVYLCMGITVLTENLYPIWMFAFLFFSAFAFIVSMVYWVSILIQYTCSINKKAWIRLIAIALILIISGIFLLFEKEKGILNVLGGIGFIWIFILQGLLEPPPYLPFRIKSGPVIFDERDARILHQAIANGFGAFWYVFPILCIFLYLYFANTSGSISIGAISLMAGGGGILISLVQSISILIQYGWKVKNNE